MVYLTNSPAYELWMDEGTVFGYIAETGGQADFVLPTLAAWRRVIAAVAVKGPGTPERGIPTALLHIIFSNTVRG